MFEFLSQSLAEKPVELLGATALGIAGVVLVQWALRLHSDDVAARFALISPWTHANDTMRAPQAMQEPLSSTNSNLSEREVARILRRFRVPTRHATAWLLTARAAAAVCLGVGCWFLAPQLMAIATAPIMRMLLSASAGIFGWFLPVLVADWSARRRIKAVVSGLPDALELLVICAEAGLALGDGIDRIVAELKRSQPELAEELELTAADLRILPSQEQALARLAARVDVPIVRSVVTTLSQTMRYGTPFAQAMRVVAGEMRSEALIRMEERANKLPALLTVPMMVFIMPTIFLVIGGPAALKVLDTFMR
ncbi:MAG TPA: type II secretion system F family protein [Rhizomicrobium sp.]|nr:type II secretion system F family protein [Rhizomicrobium sp.]